jgi:hypothetical protein
VPEAATDIQNSYRCLLFALKLGDPGSQLLGNQPGQLEFLAESLQFAVNPQH